jgi:sugar phosphate permease
MSGANNVVTSVLPLSLRDRANSGFVGGILNGCCYLGSTISSAGLGAISDAYGEWTPVFWLLLICSVVVVVLCSSYYAFTKIKNKKIARENAVVEK